MDTFNQINITNLKEMYISNNVVLTSITHLLNNSNSNINHLLDSLINSNDDIKNNITELLHNNSNFNNNSNNNSNNNLSTESNSRTDIPIIDTRGIELFYNLLDPIVIFPTQSQIDSATQVIYFGDIINPLNTACPISLENFNSFNKFSIISTI